MVSVECLERVLFKQIYQNFLNGAKWYKTFLWKFPENPKIVKFPKNPEIEDENQMEQKFLVTKFS